MKKWKIIRIALGIVFAMAIVATLGIYLKPLTYGHKYESEDGKSSYVFYKNGKYKHTYESLGGQIVVDEYKYEINESKTEIAGLSEFNHFKIKLDDGSVYNCKSATWILIALVFWYVILALIFALSFAWEKGEQSLV